MKLFNKLETAAIIFVIIIISAMLIYKVLTETDNRTIKKLDIFDFIENIE